jgi:hypothetical protein
VSEEIVALLTAQDVRRKNARRISQCAEGINKWLLWKEK